MQSASWPSFKTNWPPAPNIAPSKVTFEDYLKDWLKTYVDPTLSPTTASGYRVNIEKHIIPHLGKVPLQELKPMQLQKFYLDKLQNGRSDGKGGLSARSVLYIHRNIHEALEHAVRMQMVTRNVAKLVTLPKARPYEPRVYGEEQMISLLKAAQNTDMELAINLAASLGLRRGELLGLRWSSVDLEGKKIVIRENLVGTQNGLLSKAPKTGTSTRTLDIPEGLIPILKKHKKSRLKISWPSVTCTIMAATSAAKAMANPTTPATSARNLRSFWRRRACLTSGCMICGTHTPPCS